MNDYNSPDYMRKLLESVTDSDGYEFDSREEAILDRAWSLVDLLSEYAEDVFEVIEDRDLRLAFQAEYQRLADAKSSGDDGNLLAAANSFVAKLEPFWLDDDFEKISDPARGAIVAAYRKLSNAVNDIMDDENMVNEDEDLIEVPGLMSMRRDQAERGALELAQTIVSDIGRGVYSSSDADTLKSYLYALSDGGE
jgi:hypothetical protein